MTQNERREMYRKRFIESREQQLQQSATRRAAVVPDHLTAMTHETKVADGDIIFQQCGGGRRVIRKHIGGT